LSGVSPEDGRFGDQRYLDDWPELFGSFVHILQDTQLALAPWNAMRFPYSNAVFYHFHALRILSRNQLQIGHYSLPLVLKHHVYKPYCDDLKVAINQLEAIEYVWKPQAMIMSLPKRISLKLKRLFMVYKLLSPSGLMYW